MSGLPSPLIMMLGSLVFVIAGLLVIKFPDFLWNNMPFWNKIWWKAKEDFFVFNRLTGIFLIFEGIGIFVSSTTSLFVGIPMEFLLLVASILVLGGYIWMALRTMFLIGPFKKYTVIIPVAIIVFLILALPNIIMLGSTGWVILFFFLAIAALEIVAIIKK